MTRFAAVLLISSLLAAVSAQEQTPLDNVHSGAVPGFSVDLDAQRLVQFGVNEPPVWITERQKLDAKREGKNFMDITYNQQVSSVAPKESFSYPTKANATNIVKKIIPVLEKSKLEEFLTAFTSFPTRYYYSDSGKASSEFLLKTIQNYTEEYASEEQKEILEVVPVVHPWPQTSVIIRFTPKDATASSPITILGAHCDSLNYRAYYERAPGADDDGSGTASILEAFRGLLVAGYIPASPLEFHFYSAEEGGLLGSQQVAAMYSKAGVSIRAMQEYDMTAWVRAGTTEVINIITSFVNTELSDFQKVLIDEYIGLPWAESEYPGTASSDYYSWTKAGYPSCHVTEAKFKDMNSWIHSTTDRIDISDEFSFDHMLQYSRLAVAFAVELTSY